MGLPSTASQWTVVPNKGLDGLQFQEDISIPEIGEIACLVKIEAASLNYRDVAIPTGRYPLALEESIVPCSDGAGTIVAVGSRVVQHRVGDKVCSLFNQNHQSGFITPAIRKSSLGSWVNGVLREYAAYDEMGLVPVPGSLSLAECSTLSCAALTAWNALTGIAGRKVQSGDHVLVQGTGGVSLFAAQFALAFGAVVIATTSTNQKGDVLKGIGIQHVINYNSDAKWGETAKKLTPNEEGVHHIIEVGGATTMAQSLKAIRCEGVISVIGFLGGEAENQGLTSEDYLKSLAIVRGCNVGSKEQFLEMNKFIDKHQIKPFIDKRIFGMREAKEAYQYMLDAKHWGKIVIDVGGNIKK